MTDEHKRHTENSSRLIKQFSLTMREETDSQTLNALDRWDNEGGATVAPVSTAIRAQVSTLKAMECQVLRCLGAAVVKQWNDLPADVQRSLFRAASAKGTVDPGGTLPMRIARFLHNNKSDEAHGRRRTARRRR